MSIGNSGYGSYGYGESDECTFDGTFDCSEGCFCAIVRRAWGAPENAHKAMDVELVRAIVKELVKAGIPMSIEVVD